MTRLPPTKCHPSGTPNSASGDQLSSLSCVADCTLFLGLLWQRTQIVTFAQPDQLSLKAGGSFCSVPFSRFLVLLAGLRVPRLVDASLLSPPQASLGLLPVSVSLCLSSFYKDVSRIASGALPTPNDLILINYACNDPVSN